MKVAVLGGGAWGTALALTSLRGGNATTFWMRDADAVRALNERHENPGYLPGIALDAELAATDDLDAALVGAECVLAVAPAQALREVASRLVGSIRPGVPVVICAKGIERSSGKRLSEIIREILPDNPPAALSGPSFATDVARGLPTAVTVAAEDAELAATLARLLSAPQFRCYSSDDLVGVEIGGALKNVLAIAAGAVVGAGLGASAQAALVTRGFVELRRIGASFGARPETLMGLSGLGDLVLTCGSAQSRNFAYGLALGRGDSLVGMKLAEGVATAGIAATIAADRGIRAPITDAVDRMLAGTLTIDRAVGELLSRPLRAEDD
ncbi:NAD(P)H-dependent glycerol-3-phosphate dehydrogenase [Mesorhizobium sp. J428]|uniref:NAD(P)H-dependent glycerol-3-phosphate dehydrogenase n=1 Tax=Mesorhizobium sp. J428 TaxID=2898440 RepID=UPI002150C852|nr:NAD(P)H-dependent glycerol-3-phosphate dehydrogenase [Mesorhizobium sp. J428]MCR5857028.1 NAD(P)-dependent glycerol-3-phosphate dehydrogenase [Mesorhizobium sp. J428]